MKTFVTADLHLSDNPRDAYRLRWFERLPELAKSLGAKRVLVLGDITEAKDGHRAGLVNAVVDGFAALAEVAIVYVLCGNHDYVAQDVPFYRFLRHLRRVRWINSPTPLKLSGLGECLFLPHARAPDDWVDHMHDSYDWFFCHQTFNGADLGGRKAEGGGFDPGLFRGRGGTFRVVAGDVHVPQTVGPVTYVGAPYAVDFGDRYAPRVLLLEEGKVPRSIPTEGPQKRLIVLRDRDRYPDVAPGDIVKLRVCPARGNETPRAEWRAQARRWADAAGVELHSVQVVAPAAEPGAIAAARSRSRRSDEDLVRAYAKKMGKGRATAAAGLKIVEENA